MVLINNKKKEMGMQNILFTSGCAVILGLSTANVLAMELVDDLRYSIQHVNSGQHLFAADGKKVDHGDFDVHTHSYEESRKRWLIRKGTTQRADRTVKKIPSSSKKKAKTVDFQSIQIKPLNFPTSRVLARKNCLQRIFWKYAMKIEEGNKNSEKTEIK